MPLDAAGGILDMWGDVAPREKGRLDMDYRKQANDFCKKHGVKMVVGEADWGHPSWDTKEGHYVFPVTLKRKGRQMSLRFWQSLAAGAEEPEAYDVLACLTKYDPGTFKEFCAEFYGHDERYDSKQVYKAVCREWKAVERVFGDVLEELREIA